MRACLPSLCLLAALLPLTAAGQEPDPRYWRLDEVIAQFEAWEIQYPGIFHADRLGVSGQGQDIPLARISDNAAVSEPEPRLLFHGAQHANECNGTGAVMKCMATLLENYAGNPGVAARVDALELYFVPIFNVDGHDYVFGGEPYWHDWRKTLRDYNGNDLPDFPGDGVDTNRNWDWFWQQYSTSDPQYDKGPEPFSEPEVVALRDFILAERPLLVVDYHSPVTIGWSNTIFYPWVSQHGIGNPDFEVAQDIASEWASHTLTETGQHFSSIFGYDTLPKEQCWVYGHTGILSFVMEISDHCWWTGATVDSIAARVARGSETLMDRALTGPGIRGQVRDAISGQPLDAEIRIDDMHDPDVGPRLADARFGAYQRFTEPGSHTVRAFHDAYLSDMATVSVSAGAWTKLDFELVPDPSAADASEGGGSWFRFSNPVRDGAYFRFFPPADLPAARLLLVDPGGRLLAKVGDSFSPGREYRLKLPSPLPAGVYLLEARAGGQVRSVKLVHLP